MATWTHEEQSAVVAEYFAMLEQELVKAIEESCILEPDSYRALPRPTAA